MMVTICTTMMLPMILITMAVVLLLIPFNLLDGRSCIFIYFPLHSNQVPERLRFRIISVSNLTCTVRVHVSSKDVHVWAVAGRQTEAVVQLRKERL